MTTVAREDIELLLTLFSRKGQYDARTGEQSNEILQKCEELFEKDYVCCKIENEKGSLSTNYPSSIIIPFEEKNNVSKGPEFSKSSDARMEFFDAVKYKEIANKSNLARCRTRFPVPVVLYEGKFVCRSATLACGGEMLWRDIGGCIFNISTGSDLDDKNSISYTRNGALFTELRNLDIKLLKELSVSYICDLMVENKKVKYGLKVSSSEKIDKENRYCDFKIVQLPYPGCEFFKKFKDSNYVSEGLMFDWEQNYVDSSLTLPIDSVVSSLGILWGNYKMWDLVKLTQNYLKLLLSYIIEGTSSILIHCISGWDRTPLFISLLRMSLWADGRAHSSLSAVEMAYLTLAYDWYLFGHDLPSRLKAGEEILYFCFEFLKFITSEEFSTKKRCRRTSSNCIEPGLDVLIEEETPKTSFSCCSSSSPHKPENGSSSIFYTSLDCTRDHFTPSVFHSSPDSDDSDSVKSVKSNIQHDSSSSESGTSPSIITTLENLANNNGHPKTPTSSSSPVPVPNCRQRIDSMSSLGSWQYVSGSGSLLGSVTSRSSVEMLNGSHSNHNLSQENGNIGNCLNSAGPSEERADKLRCIRSLVSCAYRKAMENRESSNGERSSYFPWRR